MARRTVLVHAAYIWGEKRRVIELRPDTEDPLVYNLFMDGEPLGGDVYRNSPKSGHWFTNPNVGSFHDLLGAGQALADACVGRIVEQQYRTERNRSRKVEQHQPGERWWEDPSHLKFTSWNPQYRTTAPIVADLVQSIEDQGFLWERPILLGTDGEIGDGNRRLSASQIVNDKLVRLGETPIRVAVEQSNRTSREIYRDNESMRHHRGVELLWAYVNGYEDFSASIMRNLHALEDIMGKDGIRWMAEHNISPHAIKRAKSVATYCNQFGPARNPFIKQALYWLVDQNMQHRYNEFVKYNQSPELLYAAVMRDLPLVPEPQVWRLVEPVSA